MALVLRSFLSLLAALALAGAARAQPAPGPVAYAGHGALFSADGQELPAAPTELARVQAATLAQLLERAEPAQRDLLNQRMKALGLARLSAANQVHVRAAAISTLLEQAQPAEAARLRAVNTALHALYGRAVAAPTLSTRPRPFKASTSLLRRLKQQGLGVEVFGIITNNSGQAYIDECRAQGVPVPPAWGSPQWQAQGPLGTKFILGSLEAHVYTYESSSPRGLCIALPRYGTGAASIDTLGIICQGNDTSKACFWDNAGSVPFTGQTPLLAFKGGKALVNGNGVCTDCHAGENPFIVHPGSALDRGAILKPRAWVDPIVDASWPQNRGPGTQLDGLALPPGQASCLSCHNAGGSRFPTVSNELPGFCGSVLSKAMAAGGTMPPGAPGSTAYATHRSALTAACNPPPPQPVKPVVCRVFDDGASNATGTSDAVYFADAQTACVPDGTERGSCRRWFGRCSVATDNTAVNFRVFNDGETSVSAFAEAVYDRAAELACIPDGTATGTCRKWFGLAQTTDGRPVRCHLFDDGYANRIGPSHAIYYRAPGQVCMPDGTSAGACRKWFGQCQVE